jgi:catechol 2,3-dioxygenase-like lactoylglutathione lyase family enzyme
VALQVETTRKLARSVYTSAFIESNLPTRRHYIRAARLLNVSDIAASFAWFEKLGWRKCWDWGSPPTFGSVGPGECEIFLCQRGQGSRGKGASTATFGPLGDQTADKGVWISLWVDDVDEVHRHRVAAGLDVTLPPTDMSWNVREMHVRHPDGHVFRVGKGIEHE